MNKKNESKKTNRQKPTYQFGRYAKIVSFIFVPLFSLISFPEHLPWLIGFWLALFTLFIWNRKSTAVPILFCLIIVVIKLPHFDRALIGLLTLLAVACGIVFAMRNKKESRPKSIWILTGFLWISLLAFSFQYRGNARGSRFDFDETKPIACLGDSLTDSGYPDELAKMISAPVADFGFDGIDSKQGLKYVDEILSLNPQCVIIELGGHDYNKGFDRHSTYKNLQNMIEAFQRADAAVIIVEVPRGFVSDPFYGLERQLAREYDLELIPDTLVRRFVFWSPICPPGMWSPKSWHLSNDGLHPNKKGNRLFADYATVALVRTFGEQIVK